MNYWFTPRVVKKNRPALSPRLVSGFTRKYRITRLVYFEEFADIRDAIAREKEIKGWKRLRKISLIESRNPTCEDLAKNWFLLPPNPFL